jgi:hypothetical protein
MKKFTILCIGLVMAVAMQAQIIHVPGDYPTIQQGINAATSGSGDTVLVAEGTYYEQINFLGKKRLVVASQFIEDGDTSHISKTIIDGSQVTNTDSASVVYFITGEDTTSIICGFTIQGGKGTNCWWDVYESIGGAGIYITHSNATIRNNIIRNNTLNDTLLTGLSGCCGGGIYASYGTPGWIVIERNRIISNKILSNHDWTEGGGIYVYGTHARIVDNVVANNVSKNTGYGHGTAGGIICEADTGVIKIIIKDNLIENNEARAIEYGYGSGISLWWIAEGSVIENNRLIHNKNDWNGGGLDLYSNNFTTIQVDNNYFLDNEAMNGGAIDIDFDSTSQILLLNNIFNNNIAHNQGGAIWINRSNSCPVEHMLISVNNSFSGNHADSTGGAIYVYEDNPVLLNSIFWQNPDMSANEIVVESGYSETAFSDLDTNKISGIRLIGTGVINTDPIFSDKVLLTTEHWSPCVDKGTKEYTCNCGNIYHCPGYDITGITRPAGIGYDMGAYDMKAWGQGIGQIANDGLRITNWPNPFSNSTTFSYTLQRPSQVTLQIYNSFGQLVSEPVNTTQASGEQTVQWKAGGLPSGIYYYRMGAGGTTGTGKMVKW